MKERYGVGMGWMLQPFWPPHSLHQRASTVHVEAVFRLVYRFIVSCSGICPSPYYSVRVRATHATVQLSRCHYSNAPFYVAATVFASPSSGKPYPCTSLPRPASVAFVVTSSLCTSTCVCTKRSIPTCTMRNTRHLCRRLGGR